MLEIIKEKFKEAIATNQIDDRLKRFEQLEKETSSADIPIDLKNRILERIEEHRFQSLNLLQTDISDLE